MAEAVLRPTGASVDDFIARAEPLGRREDAVELKDIMDRVTGETAAMWGPSIVGYGFVHYRYATGREGDMPVVGFSPRTASMSVYGVQESPQADALLGRLGPYKAGVSCVWIGRFNRIDTSVLEQLVAAAWEDRATLEHAAAHPRG